MKWVAMISFVVGMVVSVMLSVLFLVGPPTGEDPTEFVVKVVVCELCVGIAPMVMGIGFLAFSKENFNT